MSAARNIVTFISSKGGSGKTVTAASLATLLSELGIKVLLIDADAATNGLTLLFLEHLLRQPPSNSDIDAGLFELSAERSIALIDVSENLTFIPAAVRLTNTEGFPLERFGLNLKRIIDHSSSYDVIFIDAQAGSDAYAQIAAGFSYLNIIVSEYDPVSAQGIDRLKIIFHKELTPPTTYTLFNKVLPEFSATIGDGLAIARYLPPIPWDADVVRAFALRDLAINLDTPNPYTLAISQLALAFLPDISRPVIAKWRGEALERVTDPVKNRLNHLYNLKASALSFQEKRQKIRYTMEYILPVSAALVGSIGLSISFAKLQLGLDRIAVVYLLFGILIASGLGFVLHRTYKHYVSESLEFTELEAEISSLETSLSASESALRISDGGVYSTQRRRRSKFSEEAPKKHRQSNKYRMEVYKDKAGEFRARFRAANGNIMFSTEGYSSKTAAMAAVESIRRNAPSADTDDQTVDIDH